MGQVSPENSSAHITWPVLEAVSSASFNWLIVFWFISRFWEKILLKVRIYNATRMIAQFKTTNIDLATNTEGNIYQTTFVFFYF